MLYWYTSAACPFKAETTHQVACTRENTESYTVSGHYVCQKGKHKNLFPLTPRTGYE